MDGLIAITTTLILVAPLHFAVQRLLNRLDTPAYLREVGVIILNSAGLDACTEEIGHYAGAAIYRTVTFRGMVYEFAGVTTPGHKAHMDRNELYLDPGLLYVARD